MAYENPRQKWRGTLAQARGTAGMEGVVGYLTDTQELIVFKTNTVGDFIKLAEHDLNNLPDGLADATKEVIQEKLSVADDRLSRLSGYLSRTEKLKILEKLSLFGIAQVGDVITTYDWSAQPGRVIMDGGLYDVETYPEVLKFLEDNNARVQLMPDWLEFRDKHGYNDAWGVSYNVQLPFRVPDTSHKWKGELVQEVKLPDGRWYRIFKSGWTEQGGVATGVANSTGALVTLPIELANADYVPTFGVVTNLVNNSVVAIKVRSPADITTTSFRVLTSYASANSGDYLSTPFGWEVRGFAADIGHGPVSVEKIIVSTIL